MLLKLLKNVPPYLKLGFPVYQKRFYGLGKILQHSAKPQEYRQVTMSPPKSQEQEIEGSRSVGIRSSPVMTDIFPTTSSRVVPMVLSNKESIILPFDDVPGPKSLKYVSHFRNYVSAVGTQLTVAALTIGLSIGSIFKGNRSGSALSSLFDEYGPVVRFVSPIGGDIVLINHPDHIQKVFALEGDHPVRSTLDSLEKYRMEHRNHIYGGLYSIHGEEWSRQRGMVQTPLQNAVIQHLHGLNDVCENFTDKIYNMRNYQDEVPRDLYKELHKWAFDCMGLLVFAKKFTMLDTEIVYSQCDMAWLYHSLERATKSIIKCESGFHLWKLFPTPAWNSLVKNCDNLDNLIGKHVLEAEQKLVFLSKENEATSPTSMINAMLSCEDRMGAEDIATVLMDMLLIGVNTITSSMSFLLYNLAKHQKVQKVLCHEINSVYPDMNMVDVQSIKDHTPYLQACIKENLRLVPPIPLLTRILPKNITLDKYNIPRGTLIIMSTQDASLKESNFDDATKFCPERWLNPDSVDYHAFASIPFGFGTRKCLGQNVAEILMSLLTIRILQKYKIEYHYGDIHPTRSFITKPNKPLKLRFIDRIY